MRYAIPTIAACALAATVGVFAQEAAPAQQQPAGEPDAKATLTGCVVQAKTTDGGTAFVLTKTEGGSAAMYVLGGSAQSDWTANVNKKVEVTGAVQTPPPSNDKEGGPTDSKVVRPPMVVVETVKVVAESC
jgi:hypothetical protein